jgi:hemerythrin
MQCIKWTSERHGVYLPEIDAEHQELFRMADELYQAVESGAMLAAVEPRLRDLIVCVEHHFTDEEELMRSRRYPSYVWHKGQHDVVRGKVKELEAEIGRGDREALLPALNFLTAWMQTHTAVSDRMLGAFVRNKSGRQRKGRQAGSHSKRPILPAR